MTTLLFLALILTFEMLPVSSTTTSPTTTGEISIIGQGSLEAGSALILSCIIPHFTVSAQWGRENTIYTTCINAGICSLAHTENYTFESNTSGIFVTIKTLSMADNGTIWMCNTLDYTTSYTVIVQTTIAPTTGKISIVGKGSLEVDSVLNLSCIIPAFTGAATWRRGNISLALCTFDSLCTSDSMERYTFAGNNSGIFVTIYPLTMSDNGTKWICYDGDDSISYTVLVQSTFVPPTEPSIPTNQPPTGNISINGKGSLEVDSVLTLSCIIPSFKDYAEWTRGNITLAICRFGSGCVVIDSMTKYSYAVNTSGIFVRIYPLSVKDNGTELICHYNEDSTTYTVFVQPSIPTNHPPTVSCEEPYQKIGNGCYSIHDNTISGDEAFASCTDPGAYLANFETVEEAMFMKVFLQRNKTGISYFVGGRNVNRYLSNGDWRWIKHGNATKMTYFAFAPGQPSWSAEKGEDCMFFYANDRYNFYNVMCDNGHFLGGFICEI